MQGWILLWKIVFICGLTIFTAVALWVTFAGARDIKKLILKLKKSNQN